MPRPDRAAGPHSNRAANPATTPAPDGVDRSARGSAEVVLASTSKYRAALIAELGLDVRVVAPEFDERRHDHLFDPADAGGFALFLARGKASSVSRVHPRAVVIGADQIAVISTSTGTRLLHKASDAASATRQLMSMSGSTHELINGLVVMTNGAADEFVAVDRHLISMRGFTEAEARSYVEQFEPYDCVGSYRLEDDSDLVESVVGDHRSGVIGLPLPTLCRLLAAAGVATDWTP